MHTYFVNVAPSIDSSIFISLCHMKDKTVIQSLPDASVDPCDTKSPIQAAHCSLADLNHKPRETMQRREFVCTVAVSVETVAGDVLSPFRARLWSSQTLVAEPP